MFSNIYPSRKSGETFNWLMGREMPTSAYES